MGTLQHHGILGMKWGIRRYQNKDGSLTALGRKHQGVGKKKGGSPPPNAPNNQSNNQGQNQDRVIVTSKQARKRTDPSKLSNEELQARIQRIQLENQYKQLTQKETSAGVKFIQTVLSDTATSVAKKQLSAFANNQIKKLVDRKLGRDEERLAEKNWIANQAASEKAYRNENAAFDNMMRRAGEYAYNYTKNRSAATSTPTYSSVGSDFVSGLLGAGVAKMTTQMLALPPG